LRQRAISYFGRISLKKTPLPSSIKQSNIVLKWLSYTAEKNDVYIQHKRNGGEKTVGQYSLDGYDEETQVFIVSFLHRYSTLTKFFYRVFEMLCKGHSQQGQLKDHA
jgi:hypothetical protein